MFDCQIIIFSLFKYLRHKIGQRHSLYVIYTLYPFSDFFRLVKNPILDLFLSDLVSV